MEIEFDPAKDVLNIRKHGLSLALAAEPDWDHAAHEVDNRFSYSEVRTEATVPMGNRLYRVTFTERGEKMRVISLGHPLAGRPPRAAPRKAPVTLRLDVDLLAALKATGKGWQTRINEILRAWLAAHPPSPPATPPIDPIETPPSSG
ncbi:MAG: BrnA antitoxin family protein [Zoogloeaceae bacterium]|jgi:uncharacterized protein (DUF4415 family)|nr:BrnA antitoxin family protein [Zoogloeaceae bacterium]